MLTVKVLDGALTSSGGNGKVVNGGETATVKVGNDSEFTLEVVENPLPTGSLVIEKALFVDGADQTQAYADKKSFHVKVFTNSNGVPMYVTNEQGTLSQEEDEVGIFEIHPGIELTIRNLPDGRYTVQEVTEDGAELDGDAVEMGSMTFLAELSRTSSYVTVASGTAPNVKASIVNAYTTGKYCVAVTKQWLLNGEAYVNDDLVLKVKLQRSLDGQTWSDVEGQTEVVLNAANNWAYVAVGMDQMNEAGKRYAYRWTETDIPEGWKEGLAETVQSTTKDGKVLIFLTKLTNHKTTAGLPITVKKVWADGAEAHAEETITVKLLKNGREEIGSYELSAENGWSETVEGLPFMEDGEPVWYSWSEVQVPGYRSAVETLGGDTTITNTRIPTGVGAFTATKTWTEGTGTATLTLIGRTRKDDGSLETVYTSSRSVTGDGTVNWEDAPLFTEDGRPILYSLKEEGVNADGTVGEYISSITGDEESGYTVVNHGKPEPETIEKIVEKEVPVEVVREVEKVVEKEVPVEVIREVEKIVEKEVPVEVIKEVPVEVIREVEKTVEVPVERIVYVNRTQPAGNTVKDEEPEEKPETEEPEEEEPEVPTVSASVTKVWDDNNNEHGMRPGSVRVTLSNGQSYILSEGNGWSITVNDLPAEENGEPITYSWSEQSVTGYVCTGVSTVNGNTVITNRYQPVVLPSLPGNEGVKGEMEEPVFIFEDYETPLGVQVIINHVGDCFE